MGVHGLWRLIEPSGNPVPLETLENKVLAVDISIWLHQAIKGFQDSKGAPVPNAHLLGIFHRVCKLLYYRIQPVFVFDGSVPVLKRHTIAKRNEQKSKNVNDANRLQKQLLNSLLKHSAINAVLSEKAKANLENDLQKGPKNNKHENDMYTLPPTQFESTESSSSDEDSPSTSDHLNITKHWDLHTIDAKSAQFKSLPANVRHEILSDLKETRKQSSWGRIHELPTQSNDFAGYQMKRLLKRHAVQVSLEEAEKEMDGHSLSLAELEALLANHGVITSTSIVNRRIASDENKRYIYIKSLKHAIEETATAESKTIEHDLDTEDDCSEKIVENDEQKITKSIADEEYEKDLGDAIRLSLQEQATTSTGILAVDNVEYDNYSEVEKSKTSEEQATEPSISSLDQEYDRDLEEAIRLSLQEKTTISKGSLDTILEEDEGLYSDSSDSAVEFESANNMLTAAKNYMTEYSGLPPNEIVKILKDNSVKSTRMLNAKLIQTLKRNSGSSQGAEMFKTSDIQQQNFSTCQINSRSTKTTTNADGIVSSKSVTSFPSEASNKDTVCNTSLQTFNSLESKTEIHANRLSSNQENVDLNPVDVMSDSDTSDDFLEVESPRKEHNLKTSTSDSNNKQSLEITIEKVSHLDDDDMFSDIFKDIPDNRSNMKTSSVLQQPPLLGNIHKAVSNLPSASRNIDTNTQSIERADVRSGVENTSTSIEKSEDSGMQTKEQQVKVDDVIISEGASSSIISSTKETSQNDSVLLKEILRPSTTEDQQKTTLTTTELKNMKNALAKESDQLMKEKSAKERLAANITEQMYQEAQELLELFGLPYIIAPMEAEAQCAFLNEIALTDGTITDDSDIWLFGGKTVYKNFFNQSKHVLEFQAENIQHSFKLSRYEMILLALLVGSDYTTGIQGIGPVTALEILAAFPPPKDEPTISQVRLLTGLQEFRKWFCSGKLSKTTRASLRNKLKNIEICEHFPSLQVVQAYLEPTVESSRDPFSWQKPDIKSLMEFARHKFGWSQKKCEEILKPVLKKMEETSIQTKMTNYFKIKRKLQANDAGEKMSKRVKMAVTKMGANGTNSDELSDADTKKQPKRRSKTTKKKSTTDPVSSASKEDEDNDVKILKETKKSSRGTKKKNTTDLVSSTSKEDEDNDVKIVKETEKSDRGTKKKSATDPVSSTSKKDEDNDVKRLKETKTSSRGTKKKSTIDPAVASASKEDEDNDVPAPDAKEDVNDDVNILKETKKLSRGKIKEMKIQMNEMLLRAEAASNPENITASTSTAHIYRKEVIHQKVREKADNLRNKLRAIEVYRKSKRGPGYLKKRQTVVRQPKEDAELSENSD